MELGWLRQYSDQAMIQMPKICGRRKRFLSSAMCPDCLCLLVTPSLGEGVKGPRFEADRLSLYSAQCRNEYSYTSNPAIYTHALCTYCLHYLWTYTEHTKYVEQWHVAFIYSSHMHLLRRHKMLHECQDLLEQTAPVHKYQY